MLIRIGGKHSRSGQRLFIGTDMKMNTKRPFSFVRQRQIEEFKYADAVKNKLTPGKQTAESPAGRKVKQWGN